MRKITNEKLKEILEKHKKWLNSEDGGKRAELRYVYLQGFDLRHANLRNADLWRADLSEANLQNTKLRETILCNANVKYVKRRWFVYTGAIGSRNAETLYFADCDNVRCGCWRGYGGGTLTEFKARIDKVYPTDSKNEEHQRYRLEYLSAIKMFEGMRKEYLQSAKKK